MDKKYLAKIIASDNEGLQMISACSAAKVKVSDIKYLLKQSFLIIDEKQNRDRQEDIKSVFVGLIL